MIILGLSWCCSIARCEASARTSRYAFGISPGAISTARRASLRSGYVAIQNCDARVVGSIPINASAWMIHPDVARCDASPVMHPSCASSRARVKSTRFQTDPLPCRPVKDKIWLGPEHPLEIGRAAPAGESSKRRQVVIGCGDEQTLLRRRWVGPARDLPWCDPCRAGSNSAARPQRLCRCDSAPRPCDRPSQSPCRRLSLLPRQRTVTNR
jgi:hypothetical protein